MDEKLNALKQRVQPGDRELLPTVIERIGDKWSLFVLILLAKKPRRFTELVETVPDISRRMLTVTLRALERDGVLEALLRSSLHQRQYAEHVGAVFSTLAHHGRRTLRDADLEDCSLYEELEARCDVRIHRSVYSVRAEVADAHLVERDGLQLAIALAVRGARRRPARPSGSGQSSC